MLFYSAIAYSCSDLGLLMDSQLKLSTVRVVKYTMRDGHSTKIYHLLWFVWGF